MRAAAAPRWGTSVATVLLGNFGRDSAVGELISQTPRVEDADVVVESDECHEASNAQSGLVLLSNGGEAEPEEHCGRHHQGQHEGSEVVHQLVLALCHGVHHG